MRLIKKFLKFVSFMIFCFASLTISIKSYAEVDLYSYDQQNEKQFSECAEFYENYCKNCSSEFAVLRFSGNEDEKEAESERKIKSQYAELLFSPTNLAKKFNYNKFNFFKDLGCELTDSKTGLRYLIRPYFSYCFPNTVNLEAEGDCAQIKFHVSLNGDNKAIPLLQNLDDECTGTGELKRNYGYDNDFKFVDGRSYRVKLFKSDVFESIVPNLKEFLKEGNFNPNFLEGRAKSSFNPEDVVCQFDVKAQLVNENDNLWNALKDKAAMGRLVSSFEHPEEFDSYYFSRLIQEHHRNVAYKSESKRLARLEN